MAPIAGPGSPAAYASGPSQMFVPAAIRSLEQWQAHVAYRIRTGQPPHAVLAELAAAGCPPQQAYAIVRGAIDGILKSHLKAMAVGGVVALVGLAITLFTYNMASGGGTYFVFWGPVVLGGFYFVRSLWAWSNVPRL